MTRETAIKGLKAFRKEFSGYEPNEEMFDMAIQALEQEPTTKDDLGVDCISREQAIEEADKLCLETGYDNEKVIEMLNDLPSVTPIRPKGHWVEEFNDLEGEVRFTCSSCGKYQLFGTDFCYHCGAKMVEPQESEEWTDMTDKKVTCYTCRFCKIYSHGGIYCALREKGGQCYAYNSWESQEDVLDKIRAEIETKYGQCDICEYFEDYDYEENDISEYRQIGNIADILQIIDKYKVESEDKE